MDDKNQLVRCPRCVEDACQAPTWRLQPERSERAGQP
jgi:hypothetical protein